MKQTFYVMGKKKLGGEFEQLNMFGFENREDAVWFSKVKQGEYRWVKIVPHTESD